MIQHHAYCRRTQQQQDYSKYQKRLKRICGAALLILDDFLLHTITDEREVKILFEILEKRCEINLSTIILSLIHIYNLHFYNNLMLRIREALDNGTFDAFYCRYVNLLDTRI